MGPERDVEGHGKGKNSKLVISLSESGGLVPQVGILGVVL